MEKGIFALAEELKSLRDHKSALEDEVKVTNGKIENVTADLTAAMVENETPSFTHKQFQFSLVLADICFCRHGRKAGTVCRTP
jgi:flagellar basal body rod protein FlgF